jgi:hypothetical protein
LVDPGTLERTGSTTLSIHHWSPHKLFGCGGIKRIKSFNINFDRRSHGNWIPFFETAN